MISPFVSSTVTMMDIDENSVEMAPPGRFSDEASDVEYSKKSVISMGRSLSLACYLCLIPSPWSDLISSFNISSDDLIQLLDSTDNHVENLRKEAIKLQDKRDYLLTRIDMLKNTDLLTNLSEADQEEIGLTLKRINERLEVRNQLQLQLATIFINSLARPLKSQWRQFVTTPKLTRLVSSTTWLTISFASEIQSQNVRSVRSIWTRAAPTSTTPYHSPKATPFPSSIRSLKGTCWAAL